MRAVRQHFFQPQFVLTYGFLLLCFCGTVSAIAQAKFPIGTYSNGEFTITFSADGNHTVTTNGETLVKGSYTIKENVIEITDKEGQFACTNITGKYKWTAEEKALKFEKIEDECDGRASALTQAWTKK